MYWLVNADMPAVLSPLDSDGRWTFGCPAALAKGDPADLIRQGLGFDIDLEILSRDEWTAHQLIATTYRAGPVFLAGDACHLHPPFGGFGMNMGIDDALGIVLGSRYHQLPLMLPGDGTSADDDATDYRPSASAGCLAPHAWLREGTAGGASLYDHFNNSGLTLLVTRQALEGGAAAIGEVAAAQAIPLRILAPDCQRLVQLYGCDFALIRPDQYIAWSGDGVEEACVALSRAAGRDAGAQSPQVSKKETTCATAEIH